MQLTREPIDACHSNSGGGSGVSDDSDDDGGGSWPETVSHSPPRGPHKSTFYNALQSTYEILNPRRRDKSFRKNTKLVHTNNILIYLFLLAGNLLLPSSGNFILIAFEHSHTFQIYFNIYSKVL